MMPGKLEVDELRWQFLNDEPNLWNVVQLSIISNNKKDIDKTQLILIREFEQFDNKIQQVLIIIKLSVNIEINNIIIIIT